MIDESPVPADSLGSLFAFASWLYPRVWTGFVLSWAAAMLPAGLISLAAQKAVPGGFAGAVQEQAWGRAAFVAGVQLLYWSVVMCHGWINIVLVEAASRGADGSFGDAVGRMGARLPALVWTFLNNVFRLLPLGLAGGAVAGLTVRDSPFIAAGAMLLVALPVAFFTIRWSLSTFATLFEGLSGGAALRRSSELSGGRAWLFAFHFALVQALIIVPATIISVVGLKVLPAWAAALLSPAAGALLIAPLSCGLFLALYRRESARFAPAPEGAVPA